MCETFGNKNNVQLRITGLFCSTYCAYSAFGYIYIYVYIHNEMLVILKKVYDRNVVNKYGLYSLLGVIIYNLIDCIYT